MGCPLLLMGARRWHTRHMAMTIASTVPMQSVRVHPVKISRATQIGLLKRVRPHRTHALRIVARLGVLLHLIKVAVSGSHHGWMRCIIASPPHCRHTSRRDRRLGGRGLMINTTSNIRGWKGWTLGHSPTGHVY